MSNKETNIENRVEETLKRLTPALNSLAGKKQPKNNERILKLLKQK
jgi:hypothetical protein